MMKILRRYMRWRNNRDGSQPAVAACCDNGVQLKASGDEYFVACSGCGEYIGHIMNRDTALIALRFKHHLAHAIVKQEVDVVFSEHEMDVMADAYIALLTSWASDAATAVLQDYAPAERI